MVFGAIYSLPIENGLQGRMNWQKRFCNFKSSNIYHYIIKKAFKDKIVLRYF